MSKKIEPIQNNDFFDSLTELLQEARKSVVQAVNRTMVYTYFEIGRLIVEEDQKGEKRAGYGKALLKEVSKKLIAEFGKGFSETNLKQMRQFYLIFEKSQTLSDKLEGLQKTKPTSTGETLRLDFKLSWSHYLILMRIKNEEERRFYEIEAINNNWSLRELKRQFNSALTRD